MRVFSDIYLRLARSCLRSNAIRACIRALSADVRIEFANTFLLLTHKQYNGIPNDDRHR
jgi:hypothetical protein